MRILRAFTVGATLVACGSSSKGQGDVIAPPATSGSAPAGPSPTTGDTTTPAPPDAGAPSKTTAPLELVAVTFNTGMHDQNPNDNFSGSNAKIVETYYGSGLSWNAAIVDTSKWFANLAPDIVGLQEIFDPAECATVPLDKRSGFVCETWKPGDPTVAESVLGPGYQIACHPGHHDICLGVKLTFGKFQGCTGAVCLDGLTGGPHTCGFGARVGRGVIELAGGGTLTVVSVHASSGSQVASSDCRKLQFDQIFVNLDGAPAANGQRNIILGDFNTDPGRLTAIDPSAQALANRVGTGKTFHFVTDVGPNVIPTYLSPLVPLLPVGFNIDHVVSDKLNGSCWTAGLTSGHPPPSSTEYFDHKPGVCALKE